MSRTLKSLESSGAALAALCIAGVSQAGATTVNYSDITHGQLHKTDIAIDSSTAQFYYDSVITAPINIDNPPPGPSIHYPGGDLKASFGSYGAGALGAQLTGLPSVDPAGTYTSSTADTVFKTGTDAVNFTGYIQLQFLVGSSEKYGYASFEDGDLKSITGDFTSITLT